MKIILEHEDINTALVNYVASLGIDLSGKDIVVELTAGRKENGNSAAIEITTKKVKGKVIPLNKPTLVNTPEESLPETEVRSIQEDVDEGVFPEIEDNNIDPETELFG